MTTSTPTKPNHALDNCKGQLETIVELYNRFNFDETDDQAREEVAEAAREMALDVCWKSDDWQAVGAKEGFTPSKGRVLLSWGGPACQVICDLEDHYPTLPEIQWQDWGTPWTSHTLTYKSIEYAALEWFINLFWWGE